MREFKSAQEWSILSRQINALLLLPRNALLRRRALNRCHLLLPPLPKVLRVLRTDDQIF